MGIGIINHIMGVGVANKNKQPKTRVNKETDAQKEARLQRMNAYFDNFTKSHNMYLEELAEEADIVVSGLYKWLGGYIYAPQPHNIAKLLKYLNKASGRNMSRRILGFIYGDDVIEETIGSPIEISDEEWIFLENIRKLPDSKRKLANALIITMAIQDDQELTE